MSPGGIAIVVLAADAMAGMGAVIGFWSPTAMVTSLATQVLQNVITLLAPEYLPADALTASLRVTSLLWPTTHAALALRAVVVGAPFAAYWSSIAILAGYTFVSFVVIPHR